VKAIQLVPAMQEGGVEHYAVLLNRVLTNAGWDNVTISKGGRLVTDLERAGGRHIILDLKSKNPLTYFTRAAKLRRILATEKPDVVCVHSRVPAWIFLAANRSLHIKWMAYAHGANSISRYSQVMTRGALTMCPSSFIANYLKDAYSISDARLRIVPHAVDAACFDPTQLDRDFISEKRREWQTEGKFIILSVGRITRLKGFDTLIRALARANMPDAKLIIVGGTTPDKEPYLAELRALAKSLNLLDSVVFAGAQEKIAECLSMADAVVSGNTTKPESFGLSMAEALTMDKPVIAKAFGGAVDIVRNGKDGILISSDLTASDAAADFAQAFRDIRRVHFDGIRTAALSRFNLDLMAQRTLAVYNELLHA
jgi:glycosyltransferase involved in cell wall biosynthesis